MKNMFKTLAAVAMIALAASCSKDAAEAPAVVDETAKVSFTVELPGIASRATNDGTTATELHYAVYQDNGDNTNTLLFSTDAEDQVKTMSSLSTTVELDLVSQQTYDIVFWAQAPGAYDPDFAAKSVAMNYDANKVGSNEARDAFVYVWNNLTVNGSINETVTLRRPFAQLNVALTDGQIEAAQKAGFTLDQVKVSAKTHNAFGFFAAEQGAPVGEMIDIEFAAADYELTPNTIKVNNVDYDWVSFNYLLACTPSELVDVTIVFENENDVKTIEVPAFTNVPIERNHRTNIVGDLLTDPAKFNVVILPGFEDDDQYGVIDGQMYVKVSNAEEFKAAFENADVDLIILTEDIVLTESMTRAAADPVLMVKKGKELTIDLNGKKLSSTSTQTGKNYNMFDVRGTLTVKNGTMEYEHKGTNMNWNNSTNLFNVTDGGVLNIEGVTAKNLGGSDMGFVAHLNNWGEVTLNVDNSTLESNYVAVRLFNSGPNMNNVKIRNSTLKGGNYAFWVHNYTAEDFGGSQDKADAQKALLNLDIYDSSNTFSPDINGLRFGFTNSVKADAYGVTKTVSEDGSVVTLGSITDDGIVRRYVAGDEENTTIKKVVVGEGVTTLYDRTFRRYYALEEVVLPSTLTTIGAAGTGVFQACSALKTITLPESLTTLGVGSFYGCRALESINIPAGLTRIEENVFRETGLVSVEFHEGVTYFGKQAFRDCENIKEITIKAPQFTIEPNTFLNAAAPYPQCTIYVVNAEMKAYLESVLDNHTKTFIKVVCPNVVSSSEEFAEAIAEGGYIKLTEDITLPAENANATYAAAIEVNGKDVEIDLSGKTLKAGNSDRQKMFVILNGANAIIKNGKLEIISTNGAVDGTEVSTGGSSAVYCDGGNITMENMEIIGSQRGGHRAIEVYDGIGTFTNVNIDVNYGLGINAGAGAKATLTDCNITVNGMYSAPYNSTCFSVMGGGEMTVESGNYKLINDDTYVTGASHGGWVGIIMSSGGTLKLNGGTFTNVPATGFVPAYERPLFTCDAVSGTESTLHFNGGTYVPQEDQIAHKGGSGGTENVIIKGETLAGYNINTTLLEKMTDNGNGSWTIQ